MDDRLEGVVEYELVVEGTFGLGLFTARQELAYCAAVTAKRRVLSCGESVFVLRASTPLSQISKLTLNHVMYFLLGLRLYCQHKARIWSAFATFVLIRLGFHSLLEFISVRLPQKLLE